MSPLPEHEVRPFLARRLAQAALPADLLTDGAIAHLAQHSGGVPRVLNALTGAALFFAYRERSARVEAWHVDEAAALRQAGAGRPRMTKVAHDHRAWPTSKALFHKANVLGAGACIAGAIIGVALWQAPARREPPPMAPAVAPIPVSVQVAGSAPRRAAIAEPVASIGSVPAVDPVARVAPDAADPAPVAVMPDGQAAAAEPAALLPTPAAPIPVPDAAEPQSPRAQFELGMRYDLGKDVRRDAPRAYFWYLRAAEGGVAAAEFNVAVMRDTGDGVPRDANAAAVWYALAAAQGNHRAQYNLGLLYAAGDGVPRDLVQAEAYFRAAAAELPAAAAKLAEIRHSSH